MSPDQMDALEPFIEQADVNIRAIFKELQLTRKQMQDDKRELKQEMRDGFNTVAARCRETYTKCELARERCGEKVALIDKNQAVNKSKLSFLIGGSAMGGLGIGKLVEWLTR